MLVSKNPYVWDSYIILCILILIVCLASKEALSLFYTVKIKHRHCNMYNSIYFRRKTIFQQTFDFKVEVEILEWIFIFSAGNKLVFSNDLDLKVRRINLESFVLTLIVMLYLRFLNLKSGQYEGKNNC